MFKNRSKQIITIAALVTALTLLVAVLAYLNAGDLDRKKTLEKDAEFVLRYGEKEHRVSREAIVDLGTVEFSTIMRTSSTAPTHVTFTGVELWKILERYEIPIQADSMVDVKALDGYVSVFDGEEVLERDSVYLTIAMNGEPLQTKSEGGQGPFYLVLRNTEFAQRWVKFVEEIFVQ